MPTNPGDNTTGRGQSRRPDDRRPDESDRQWAAFLAYRDLGLGRTVEATAQSLGYPPGDDGKHADNWITRVASRRRWKERARAFDDHVQKRLDLAKQRATEKVHANFAAQAERSRYKAIADTLVIAAKLTAKAKAILDLPIVEIQIEAGDDGVTHIHKPMRGITPLAAAQMAEKASALNMAAIQASCKPIGEYTAAELRAIADAMASGPAVEAELAEMDEEEGRERLLEIEDMTGPGDSDDSGDDDSDDLADE